MCEGIYAHMLAFYVCMYNVHKFFFRSVCVYVGVHVCVKHLVLHTGLALLSLLSSRKSPETGRQIYTLPPERALQPGTQKSNGRAKSAK